MVVCRCEKLEFQPQPELQAAAKILRVYVGGLSELTAGNTHIRIVVIHVIQGVEGVHMQLELEPLGNREIFIQRAVNIEEVRPPDVGVVPRVGAPRVGGQDSERGGVKPAVGSRVGDLRIAVHQHSAEVQEGAGVESAGAGEVPAANQGVEQ